MKKQLVELLSSSIKRIHGSTDTFITGFSSDSRQITTNNMFFAIKGEQTDGNKFIPVAVKNGASVIVSEFPCIETIPVTYVEVEDINQFMAESSARFYDTTAPPLTMIGITGTNGKTTTAFFINEILKSLSIKTVFIGTIGIEICGETFHTDYTTPPAYELHRILRKGLDLGASHVIMEVSSHALKYKRVWGLLYDAVIFTNLTHEHREIHPTMEDYFQTKLQLFSMIKEKGFGLINTDDSYGEQILSSLKNVNLSGYGYNSKKIKLMDLTFDIRNRGQSVSYEADGQRHVFSLRMIGAYNAYNALAAAEALFGIGFNRKEVHNAFQSIPPVAGRLEWFDIGTFTALIDFAHTPDGIEKLLQAVREIRNGDSKIITIFGCPGSRDASKRPLMGYIAAELSDYVILTTDDIHHEEPDVIVRDIAHGITKNNFETKLDRREAITRGLQLAQPGDFLVIAGRGHEKFQYVKDEKIPFLDRAVLFEEAVRLGLEIKK